MLTRQIGRGVLLGITGGDVPPGSPNPYPISDHKMSFFAFVFRPGLQEIISSLIILEQGQKRFLKIRSPRPLYQNEVKCSAFDMTMILHSHANKTHFHQNGCALGLTLKVRVFGTRKWPIETMNAFIHSHEFPRELYQIPDPNGQILFPFSDQHGAKTLPFGAAYTFMAYIRKNSPPGYKQIVANMHPGVASRKRLPESKNEKVIIKNVSLPTYIYPRQCSKRKCC